MYLFKQVLLAIIFLQLHLRNSNAIQTVNITIALDKVIAVSSDYLASYTIDSGAFNKSRPLNFTSPTLQYMAKQLNPAILRVGGSSADKIYYFTDPKTGLCTEKLPKGYMCFTLQNLKDLINFVQNVGCKLIFGLSIGYPSYPDSSTKSWNSTNTKYFLNYIVNNGYGPYFYGFTLGNELETHAHTPASFQIDAFKQLHPILTDTFAANNLNMPLMAGPDSDCNTLRASDSKFKYIQDFIQDGCELMDIFAYHSYINKNATELVTLDGINEQYKESNRFQQAVEQFCPNGKQIVMSDEIAEHSHGGISGFNNRYEDTLWYLNAFGVLASLNEQSLVRQKLCSTKNPPDSYVLLTDIDGQNYMPLPDYWIAVLFNNLIGKNVLNTTTNYDYLKINAFCYAGNNGSVILAYVNLKNEIIDIVYNVASLGVNHMDYILTAKDNELNSADIYLNGVNLQVNNDHELPELNGNLSNSSPIQIQPYSVGLIHFVDTKSAVCL
eukprot:53327_1